MTRPKPPERLEHRLARVAREQGVDQERLRRWVSFLALCGALDRAVQAGVLANYCLKGGVAMELRFAQRARATKDMDLGMEGTRASRRQAFSEAVSLGFDQFTFRVKAQTRDMEQADTVRVPVAVQYRTRSWQTIEVDLGPANVGQIDLIDPKVRGLLDGIPDGPHEPSRARATHPFPPTFAMPPEWGPEFESLPLELGFTGSTAAEIERRFIEIIRRLERTTASPQ